MRWRDPEDVRAARGWHQAFAWLPVWLPDVDRYAWLETVYRCRRAIPGWPHRDYEWHHRSRPPQERPRGRLMARHVLLKIINYTAFRLSLKHFVPALRRPLNDNEPARAA